MSGSQILQPMIRQVNSVDIQLTLPNTGTLTVRYRDTGGANSGVKTININELSFDVTPDSAEQVIPTGFRIKLGGLTYVDRNGVLYHSIDRNNNSGTAAGNLSYVSGIATLSAWVSNAPNTVTIESLATKLNPPPVNKVTFRTNLAPLRGSSFQLIGVTIDGDQIDVTSDQNGAINSSNAKGYVDFNSGVVTVLFGEEITINSSNRPAIEAEPWYDEQLEYADGSLTKIFAPLWVEAASLKYNAVAFSYIPLDASILGLDPVRLPTDGKVPIFRVGEIAIIHHTTSVIVGTPTAGQVLNTGEVRVASIRLFDAQGTEIPVNFYEVNKVSGTATILPAWNGSAYVMPIQMVYRIEDAVQVTDAQINGDLTLNRALTHDYPLGSKVSSALLCNNLVSRLYNTFTQETWTGVWSDAPIGGSINADYNEILSPIVVTNDGAIKERWAIIFTSNSSFRLIGERVGQIATGDINSVFAPLNPISGIPYLTINPLGWGAGWTAGNVLRLNTDAATYPMWLVRTVVQGVPTVEYDDFEIQVRGDRDRS